MSENLSLEAIGELVQAALEGAGASAVAAASVARSTVRAERDGIRSHGLMYVPIYTGHVACGKVDGSAEPVVSRPKSGSVHVDAACGFAHPAIDAGWADFTAAARENGVAVLTLHNSYNCGVLGHHAERLAEEGFLGLCFTHAPASIAPVGGQVPVVGTNPFALATPDGDGGALLVIDQSASAIAKSEIMLRARKGEPIEEGWAFDENGAPTTDAAAALKGSMAPAGGYKGFGVGLTVEILASCLAGAVLSRDASPFSGDKGGPPMTGQCFIAFDPAAFSGDGFFAQTKALAEAITNQDGARLPGARRQANRARIDADGVSVDAELLARIRGFAL
jgi:(2R)-3-sulfolactate dehydrogenase (NADP+)